MKSSSGTSTDAPQTGFRSDLVEASFAAYDKWEPQLQAFAWCDPEVVLSKARAADQRGPSSTGRLLDGVPVGVKDIFDTAGIPTEYGSPIFAGRVPNRNAVAVSRLEAAGAVVFGKTVTAELAYFKPGPTTNPWNPKRTPGGSSMGSAAAVAAGVVPAAVGTQTNGSTIRPAAFCGVVGFKPTAGRLVRSGVLRFSPSLDQLGVFAATVDGAARLATALGGEAPSAWVSAQRPTPHPVLGVVRTPEWEAAEMPMRESFDAALAVAQAAGGALQEVAMPGDLADAVGVHRTIMAAEADRWIRPLVAQDLERCSPQLLGLLAEGAAVSPKAYAAARRCQRRLLGEFNAWAADFDAVITLSTLGEAPRLATTGDPVCCTRWTLVGAPALTLPCGMSPNRLPLGIQLVGRPGRDRELVEIAGWLAALLPRLGEPPDPRGRMV